MKNYKLNAVTVLLEGDTVIEQELAKQIPSNLVENTRVVVIPTMAYNILKKELKNDNDNFRFVDSFLQIIKVLYEYDKKELDANKLKSITTDYKSFIRLLQPIIQYTDMPKQNSDGVKERCGIYTMRNYNELTFISLKEELDLGVVELDINYDHIKDTPVNNDNFINTLFKAKLDATSAIYDEFKYINSDEFIRKYGNDKNKYNVFIHRVNNILNFISYRWAGKGSLVDRVYSSFTSLSRISRKHLTLNNKKFIEIDIKNCQPLLLVILAKENNLTLDINYIKDVTSGLFYEKLIKEAKRLGFTNEKMYKGKLIVDDYYEGLVIGKIKVPKIKTLQLSEREDVKILCYNDIFFAKTHKETNLVKCFKSLYPRTLETILYLSTNDVTFANKLQNLEANIILNVIPECNYFTVHDAIYINSVTELNRVTKLINEVIYNRSGGLIKDVKFGKLNDKNEITTIDKNIITTEEYNIKERAVHSAKLNRYLEFKELFDKMGTDELIEKMKLSQSTYFRYKRELIKNKK